MLYGLKGLARYLFQCRLHRQAEGGCVTWRLCLPQHRHGVRREAPHNCKSTVKVSERQGVHEGKKGGNACLVAQTDSAKHSRHALFEVCASNLPKPLTE